MKILALLTLIVGIAGLALANPGGAPPTAPEIDPGSLTTASALGVSMLLMLRGRKR